MKRKNEKVPGFDEIVFENRNKEYGAYEIRKRYNATAGLSIFSASALASLTLILLAMPGPETKAVVGPVINVIATLDKINAPDPVKPVEKQQAAIERIVRNVAPTVVVDTAGLASEYLTADELANLTKNQPVDTIEYAPVNEGLTPKPEEIFIWVEEMPAFPGGEAELLKFISQSISYPEEAVRNNIQGRVILKFVVNRDGSIDRVQVLNDIDSSLQNEAIRVVNLLPKFKPGKQNGVPVPVWFTLPVLFRLQNN
jgi:protein TonB